MHTTTGTAVVVTLALFALTGCTGGSATATAATSTVRPAPAVTTSTAVPTTTSGRCARHHRGRGHDDPRRPGVAWDPTAQGGNFDPCATLSVARVFIDGATGTSPEQLLMFHDGVYQGTETVQAYGFTNVDVAASTDDAVVVHYGYGKPGETTASASGLVTVRYQWADGAVHMLDTLPAAVTG